MTDKDCWRPSPEVLVSHLEGEAILLHMGTKAYFRLNRPGAEIWRQLEGGACGEAIVEALVAVFDVNRDDAAAGVAALLESLRESSLIQRT